MAGLFCSIFRFILAFFYLIKVKRMTEHVADSNKLNVRKFRCHDCVDWTVPLL